MHWDSPQADAPADYPTADAYLNFAVDRQQVVRALNRYAAPTNAGVALFAMAFATFWTAVAGAVLLPELWMRILSSAVAGFTNASFIILAHDAAHGNLARNPRVSKLIALCTLTPCLFNYRVWVYDHHRQHHPHPSAFIDEAWRPLSLDEWRAASPWRRLRERLYRAPIMLNFGLYLLAVRKGVIKAFWRAADAGERRSALRYFGLLAAYVAVYWTALLLAPLYSGVGSLEAWLLGFALPFFTFNVLFGYATYFQHTHPSLPWYKSPTLVARLNRQEFVATAHIYPAWFSVIHYHVFYHVVHHVHPRIPVWRLKAAFAELQRIAGPVLVVDRFSLRFFLRTLRSCKLYDYEQHRWLDFQGRATSPPIALAMANDGVARGGASIEDVSELVPASAA